MTAAHARPALDSARRHDSDLPTVERVALVDVAGLEATLEPGHALRAAAVRERLGNDRALRLALQGVVADLRRRIQRRLDVARFETPPLFLLRALRPDAGQAIGLQLDAHAQRVALGLAAARTRRVDL